MGDDRELDLRPVMTIRREAQTSPPVVRRTVISLTQATPPMSPRERARHFSMKGAGPRIRRPRAAASGMRRVVVKARVVRMDAQARAGLLAHVRYVERDGAGVNGADERFFDRASNEADGKAFAERCASDRHHFRLIVNPEDGTELSDLKGYAREFMRRVETDLGTEIDWMAGAHHDTGRPHLHVLMRGRRDDGRDLVLPREYVSHGLRGRAQELATEILGPRLERSGDAGRSVTADRFTAQDRTILGLCREGRLLQADLPPEQQTELVRRLTHLETRGWIDRQKAGVWRVPPDLRETLQQVGERDARDRAAHKALSAGLRSDAGALQAIDLKPGEIVAGAYVGHAPIGPHADGPQALVLDLTDGRLAHLRVPSLESLLALDRVPEGAVVQLAAWPRPDRPADATIAEIAAERGGVWSAAEHKLARPTDRLAFIERHERRLEAMSREGACEALGEGRFRIPAHYQAKASAADRARHGEADLRLSVLDDRPLAEQVHAAGQTYLDRELVGGGRVPVGQDRFGAEVRTAMGRRGSVLKDRGLGEGEPWKLRKADLEKLGRDGWEAAIGHLGRDGKIVALAEEGRTFSGVYLSKLHIGGLTLAVVEGRHAITLAPWRPALEACRSQALTGTLQAGAVNFTRGLQRGLGLSL